MPHSQGHDPVAVIKVPGMTAANVLSSDTIKKILPLITQRAVQAGPQWHNP